MTTEVAVIETSVAQDQPQTQTIEEREVVAYVRGFEERTMENRGYGLPTRSTRRYLRRRRPSTQASRATRHGGLGLRL